MMLRITSYLVSGEFEAFDSQITMIYGVAGGEDGGASRGEGDADQSGPGEGHGGFFVGRDADNAAAALSDAAT